MQSRTDAGRTVWEAVLEFNRESEPVSGSQVQLRFVHDALRARIDHHNETAGIDAARQRVVIYVGQYVRGQ
jgi:hypothetical protein